MHALISFLFFAGAVGILVSGANGAATSNGQNLDVLNDQQEPVVVLLPSSNDIPNLVFFYLYTRATWNNPERLNVNDTASLRRSHFDSRKPTIIVVHGWVSYYKQEYSTMMRDAFLKNSDCNVIVIDWNGIVKYEFAWASKQVVKVAQFVASMIDFLYSQGMDPSKTTVVGHSLGAHVAGLSSYYAKNKVNYVVALDPGRPNFENVGPNERLSTGDAAYVLVIHTSSDLGLSSQLGDADFYPNGGSIQVGCGDDDLKDSCSHERSYRYFAESINSNGFVARRCDNYNDFKSGKCNSNPIARMGGATPDFNARGLYYLDTNSKSPFAKN